MEHLSEQWGSQGRWLLSFAKSMSDASPAVVAEWSGNDGFHNCAAPACSAVGNSIVWCFQGIIVTWQAAMLGLRAGDTRCRIRTKGVRGGIVAEVDGRSLRINHVPGALIAEVCPAPWGMKEVGAISVGQRHVLLVVGAPAAVKQS